MNSQSLQGLLLHAEHRIRDLADWVSRVNLPSEYRVNLFICEVHADGTLKPSLELSVKFPSYGEALRWAYLYCHHHDEDKGVNARDLHPDHSMFTIQMIDFSVKCLFPPETYPASLKQLKFAS